MSFPAGGAGRAGNDSALAQSHSFQHPQMDRSPFSHFPPAFLTLPQPSCTESLLPLMCQIPGRRWLWNVKEKAGLETHPRLRKRRVLPRQGGNNWKEKQGGILQTDERLLQTLPSFPGIVATAWDGLGEGNKNEDIPKKQGCGSKKGEIQPAVEAG